MVTDYRKKRGYILQEKVRVHIRGKREATHYRKKVAKYRKKSGYIL